MEAQKDLLINSTNLNRLPHKASTEWLTVALIAGCYSSWFAAGFWLWPIAPAAAILVLALCATLHSSLMHECLHGHPTRKSWANELLVSLPIGIIWPYRRFKALHLRHHVDERLTDPFEDPESYYQALWHYENHSPWFKALMKLNNTLAGRMLLNPLLGSIGLIVMDIKLIRKRDRAVTGAWARHLLGCIVVVPLVTHGFNMPFWLYLIGPVWLGMAIIAVRTYAEHQWHEAPEGRTIIVESSWLSILFLNNNLHLVHHKHPTKPWYHLPALFSEQRTEWIAMNKGYVFPNYWALARAYMFRAKEPVAHPTLARYNTETEKQP